MQKCFFLGCFFFLIAGKMDAQYSRYIIQFKDKGGTNYSLNNPTAFLSAKALERRNRQHIAIDSTDLPVSAIYLDSIRSVAGVTLLNISKWLNQVSIKTSDAEALMKVTAFPFVKKTEIAAPNIKPSTKPGLKGVQSFSSETKKPAQQLQTVQANALDYGNTLGQIHFHQGEYLHNLGFSGEGMTIAVLDGGFYGYKTNPVFDSLRLQGRVLGEWDFVNNEESVNEDNDHGMYCLSILASNRPGYMVGSAPKAKYFLYRTEDVYSEYPIEEQNWAAAAEKADSAGVDMISCSLGYADFDDPSLDHSYPQRDGNTSIITRAADFAAKKGILVMNSAGNSGGRNDQFKFVACPADGDSVVAVGAVDINGNIAGFSSWGPNGAGRIKPNIVSVGVATTISDWNGNPVTSQGTSFANPNVAGLIACLWQAFPEFNNMEVIDAVQHSASKANNPDDRFGYGIPDFKRAYEILNQKRLSKNYQAILDNQWIKAYPVPFRENTTVIFKAPTTGKISLRLMDISGKTVEVKSLDVMQDGYYTTQFNNLSNISTGIYLIQYHDGKNRSTIQIIK